MNDIKISVSIGDKLIDTIHVSGEPAEPPKYDMKEVLKYAIHGIDNAIEERVSFGIGAEFDEISKLMRLRETVSKELKELSGNAKTQS